MNPANWSWRVRGAGYIVLLAGLGCLATGCEAGRFDEIERVYPTDLDGDQTDELVVFHDASGETGLESLDLEWLEPTGGRLSGFELSGGDIRWTGAIREVGYGSVQKGTWRRDPKLVFAANHPGPRIVEYDLETREAGWREHFDNQGDSPPSTGYWGHADGGTLVAGVQTAPRELALRGVELDSGKERWEHRLEVKPVRPTLRGSQFTGSRFVARVSSPDRSIVAVGLESGELVRLSGTSGPYLSDDRALFVRRPEEGSTSKRLYQLRDGEEKARPGERDGRPVEFRGRVAGVDDGAAYRYTAPGRATLRPAI
jgi:outer membrane protein assembly factor BamB